MAQLASDVSNQQYVGAMDPDAVMIARFYKRAVKDNFKSEKEGRPIFNDMIYCEYYPAGNTLLKMDVPAYEYHKQRFSKQWAYYQTTQKEDGLGSGTPISEWSFLSPADVENLRGAKFTTIEGIANASDAMLQSIGMGVAGVAPYVLRARAQAYLGAAQDSALPQAQAQEILALKAQTEAMVKQMADMKVMLEQKPAAPAKKGKRTMTAEHKAKMAAGRERAKAAKQQAA